MFKRVYKYKYLSKKINILKYNGTVFRPLYIDIEHKEAYFYDLFYIFLWITLLILSYTSVLWRIHFIFIN